MTPERWRAVEKLFHEVAGRPLQERAAALANVEPELRAEVEKLLAGDGHLALTAEAAGEHENAICFARRAWDEREPAFILWARQFPHYRTLHSDPRFASILLEMNSAKE